MAKIKSKKKDYDNLEYGEGSIFQRKNGDFVAKIMIDGKTKSFTSKDKNTVITKLENYKELMKAELEVDFYNMNFKAYVFRWLELTKIVKLRETSYDTVWFTINSNIVPYIGHYKVKEIDSDIVQNLINELMKKPSPVHKDKTLSFSVIKKVYEILNSCFKYAYIKKHIKDNPMITVELPSRHKFDKKELKSYTDKEVEKIIEVALSKFSNGKYIYPMGAAVIILFNTGIRMGELLGLKWCDINYKKRTTHINKSVSITQNKIKEIYKDDKDKNNDKDNKKDNYEVVLYETVKTKSSNRIIPLNENVMNALNIIKNTRYFGENSFIISSSKKTFTSPDVFKRTFKTIVEKAGVPIYGVHATRHTFATKLFREKKDVKIISQLLGHSSTSITYDTYIHVINEQEIDAINVLDGLKWGDQ